MSPTVLMTRPPRRWRAGRSSRESARGAVSNQPRRRGDCTSTTMIDDEREEERAHRGRHSEEGDGRFERLDREHADDRARDAELAAHERGSAEHDGEDRVELDVEAGGVGVGGHDVRAVQDARESGEQSARRVRAQMMPRERTPASRLASGLMPTASVSTPSAVRRSNRATITIAAIETKNANGRPTQVALRHELVGGAVDGGDESAGDQQRDASTGEHEHQSRDDRLDADDGDQEAVPDAEHERHEHADDDRDAGQCRGSPGRPSRR